MGLKSRPLTSSVLAFYSKGRVIKPFQCSAPNATNTPYENLLILGAGLVKIDDSENSIPTTGEDTHGMAMALRLLKEITTPVKDALNINPSYPINFRFIILMEGEAESLKNDNTTDYII